MQRGLRKICPAEAGHVRFVALLLAALSLLSAGAAWAQTEIPKKRRPVAAVELPSPTPNDEIKSIKSYGYGSTGSPAAAPDRPSGSANGQLLASQARPLPPPSATGLQLTVRSDLSAVSVALTRFVEVQVFTLANPYRVVIDMADVRFELPARLSQHAGGHVRAIRYGLIAPGRSRIVIETTGPVLVEHRYQSQTNNASPPILNVSLRTATDEQFMASMETARAVNPTTFVPPAAPIVPEGKTGRPVIVLDPGHGGIDGGAVGAANTVEKEIVLAVALKVRDELRRRNRYEIVMTRSDDRFVSLDQRVAISQRANADLFLSLHADAVPDPAFADQARGATLYTLSEQASSRAAQELADRENAADVRAGFSFEPDLNPQVTSILHDLALRETRNFSIQASKLLERRLGERNFLSRDPSRSAAFRVLRQPEVPSVLIELGFLTNEVDAKLMQTEDWQRRVASTLANGIDAFFSTRRRANP